MIRRFDNFYRRRPRTALAIMIAIAFIALYAADQLDKANSAALRLQMWSANARSAT
jgi:hypothetical protein